MLIDCYALIRWLKYIEVNYYFNYKNTFNKKYDDYDSFGLNYFVKCWMYLNLVDIINNNIITVRRYFICG